MKIFSKTKNDLDSLGQADSTEDIRMRFEVEKCAALVINKEEREQDDGIWQPDRELMKYLGEE